MISSLLRFTVSDAIHVLFINIFVHVHTVLLTEHSLHLQSQESFSQYGESLWSESSRISSLLSSSDWLWGPISFSPMGTRYGAAGE